MRNHIRYVLFFVSFWMSLPVTGSNLYPEWFMYPLKYENVIIGYSYNELPEVNDAENTYCVFQECIVLGTLEIFQDAVDDYLKNSNYFYYYSPDAIDEIHNRLFLIDRFCVNIITDDYISAFSLDSAINMQAPRLELEDLSVPDWIEKEFMEDDQYYYGVGIYTSIGSETDAWKTAEEHAIFSILTNLAVEYHKIKLIAEENSEIIGMEQISFIKVKYLLRNISIIERFPDRADKLFYALARIPKIDVVSPLLK